MTSAPIREVSDIDLLALCEKLYTTEICKIRALLNNLRLLMHEICNILTD